MPKSRFPDCSVVIEVDEAKIMLLDEFLGLFPGDLSSALVVFVADFVDWMSLILD